MLRSSHPEIFNILKVSRNLNFMKLELHIRALQYCTREHWPSRARLGLCMCFPVSAAKKEQFLKM